MADNLLQMIEQRGEELSSLKSRFETLLARAQASRNRSQVLSLPEFQAFGWKRLEEFLNRFEESLNVPLLEKARGILKEAGVSFSPQITDSLKSGLSTRADGLIEILCKAKDELNTIQIEELRAETRKNMAQLLVEGKWDELIMRISEWQGLEESLRPIAQEMSKDTQLLNAVFQLALQQGPSTMILTRLDEATERATQIGGKRLGEQIKLETPRSTDDPLSEVESDLTRMAERKEELRQLQGEDIELEVEEGASLKRIIEGLDNKIKRARKTFGTEHSKAESLLHEYNNMAVVLKIEERSMPPVSDLKRLEQFNKELVEDVQSLTKELEKSLTSHARTLIKGLSEGKLPKNLPANQVVDALQELLSKGFAFEVRRKE